MINKSVKIVGLICFGLTSLIIAGCFHIPNEDWLLNKDKVDTGNVEKSDEMEQVIDSFLIGIDMASSQKDENDEDSIISEIENSSLKTGMETSITENNNIIFVETGASHDNVIIPE